MIEEWREIEIPGHKGILVSNLGNVKRTANTPKNEIAGMYYTKTTGYMRVRLSKQPYKDKKRISNYFIHRLVGIAFLDIPYHLPKVEQYKFMDGIPYIINHKNGIKYDNRPDNLEWCTALHNVQHARETRLLDNSVRFTVKDVLTGDVLNISSVKELAVFFKLEPKTVYTILDRGYGFYYRNRYSVKVDENSKVSQNKRLNSKVVVFKDFVSGTVTICNTKSEVSFLTGIDVGGIEVRIKRNQNNKAKKSLGGYDFIDLPTFENSRIYKWDDYTKEEALYERYRYYYNASQDSSGKIKGIEVKDYSTGEVVKYSKGQDVTDHYNESVTYMTFYCLGLKSTGNVPRLYKGLHVRKSQTTDVWPVFTHEEITCSLSKK